MKRFIALQLVVLAVLQGSCRKVSPRKAQVQKEVQTPKEQLKEATRKETKKEGPAPRAWEAASEILKATCGWWPTSWEFLVYLPKTEAQDALDLFATALPSVSGTKSVRHFAWKAQMKYGVKGLQEVQGILFVYAGNKSVLLLKGVDVETSGGTYRIGRYLFKESLDKKFLAGKIGEWVVVGRRDWIVSAGSMINKEKYCGRLLDNVARDLTPNIFRDPYHAGIFVYPKHKVVGFYKKDKGTYVLLPGDDAEVIEFIKQSAKEFEKVENTRAFSEAGLHAKMADIGVRTLKVFKRGDTFIIRSRGSGLDAAVLQLRDYFKPYLFSKGIRKVL